MPLLGLYSWSQYTLPSGLPTGDLTGDTTPNDPAAPGYSSGATSWVGQTFTFNGGAPTSIGIDDDDADFEDGYVETGGAQTLAEDVTIDGTLYPAGSSIENEFSLINASGQEIYVVRINGVNVGFAYATGEAPTTGTSFTAAQGLDGAPADNAGGASSSSEPYADVICFAAGTRIATRAGSKPVETLVCGDLVKTADAGYQPVLWIGRTEIRLTERSENLRPVLIQAGSLGGGLPMGDLIVSQQHRVLVSAAGDAPGTASPEVFAPAKGLLPLPGVRIMEGRKSVVYIHLLLPVHSVVYSEGAPTESFYPGQTALKMMTATQRQEILACCPALKRDPVGGFGPMARQSLSVREAQAWARTARGTLVPPAQTTAPEMARAV